MYAYHKLLIGSECEDANEGCPYFKKSCDLLPGLKKVCPKTCGYCGYLLFFLQNT